MKHEHRAVKNLFENDHTKFKTIVSELLKDRASVILEKTYKTLSKDALNRILVDMKILDETVSNITSVTEDFDIPKGSFTLKDGTAVRIDSLDQNKLFKLYENLNNDGKVRFKRIIFESKTSFDRLLNLARLESKKQ